MGRVSVVLNALALKRLAARNAVRCQSLSAMAPNLTDFDLDILRKLINGEAVAMASHLRLRLELAGVIREGPQGILVTAAGRRMADQKPVPSTPASRPTETKVPVDKRGRRLPLQRRSVF
jgi:hypothetical protein